MRYIRLLVGTAAVEDRGDAQLLRQFVDRRDQAAFTALLRRHGPLVLGVCRQVLGDGPDAEDVFQATFLILARKAASVRRREALAAWLYRVALNLARTARSAAARRRTCERQAALMSRPVPIEATPPADWHARLHEEIDRLPQKYRVPVLLCYLQGATNEEAAAALGCPVGTVKGRLARARDLLRPRLERRGVVFPAGGLALLLAGATTTAAVPAALAESTVQAALRFAAGRAATAALMANGLLRAMALRRLALATWLVLLTALVGGGFLALASGGGWPANGPLPPGALQAGAGEAGGLKPPAGPDTPWGEPVDGLACRLVIAPRFATGQAIAAVIEVKNTTDKTRFLVPRLDPHDMKALAVDITGPKGKVRQMAYGGYADVVGENQIKPIGPGEVKWFEVDDLRRYFTALEAWQGYPTRKALDVPAGKYVVQFRFRSPKVPPRLLVSQTQEQGKPPVMNYRDTPPEILAGQWAGEVASAPVAFEFAPLGNDDLVVHEWGVFTVFNDARYANADRKEEWGSLPSFFYRQFPAERLRWVPAAWDKPVVYFYAKPAVTPLRLSVRVAFPEGAPVVWWPAAIDPVDDRTVPAAEPQKKPRPFRALTWEAWLGDQVPAGALGPNAKIAEFPLPADCWLRHARLPGATRLTAVGNGEGPHLRPWVQRPETERFLYYDGLVPAPDYLRCEKADAKGVTLRNRANFDLGRLFVVDRRAKGVVGFASVGGIGEPFKAGTALMVEPAPVPLGNWPAAGLKQVRAALVEAGLFGAEADALLTTWQKRLLAADGVTAFHLLPQAEYDRMLPLDVLPAPAVRPVRVGIALHPHVEVEPVLVTHVAALIRQLDDEDFEQRSVASAALLQLGPLAVALLRAELQKTITLEMRRRIEAVLERVDASAWLEVPAATKKAGK
jgi:RNA polymerase sigma factor (sigma-70 family)